MHDCAFEGNNVTDAVTNVNYGTLNMTNIASDNHKLIIEATDSITIDLDEIRTDGSKVIKLFDNRTILGSNITISNSVFKNHDQGFDMYLKPNDGWMYTEKSWHVESIHLMTILLVLQVLVQFDLQQNFEIIQRFIMAVDYILDVLMVIMEMKQILVVVFIMGIVQM